MPKAFFGVMPPLQDSFSIEGDFANCFVKKYLTPCIVQDGIRENVVDKAGVGELMC